MEHCAVTFDSQRKVTSKLLNLQNSDDKLYKNDEYAPYFRGSAQYHNLQCRSFLSIYGLWDSRSVMKRLHVLKFIQLESDDCGALQASHFVMRRFRKFVVTISSICLLVNRALGIELLHLPGNALNLPCGAFDGALQISLLRNLTWKFEI